MSFRSVRSSIYLGSNSKSVQQNSSVSSLIRVPKIRVPPKWIEFHIADLGVVSQTSLSRNLPKKRASLDPKMRVPQSPILPKTSPEFHLPMAFSIHIHLGHGNCGDAPRGDSDVSPRTTATSIRCNSTGSTPPEMCYSWIFPSTKRVLRIPSKSKFCTNSLPRMIGS